MRRSRRGTPFPTGLFKSREFLQKVEVALRGGVARKGVMLHASRPNLVRVVDARTKQELAKAVVGEDTGKCRIVEVKEALRSGKGSYASAVVLPKAEVRRVRCLGVGDGARRKKRKAAKGLRAARA